jgi:purine-binding chemotaxis protein CheW
MLKMKGASPSNKSASRQIDWEAVRQRISQNLTGVLGTELLSDDALQAAWARRASQVAAAVHEEEQGEQVEVAVIRLDRELYGLSVEFIFDIRPLGQITRVPRAPDWVAGVVNLRGQIISVVDLLRFLGLSASEERGSERFMLLVQSHGMELALLADEVLAIEAIPTRQIQEAGNTVRGLRPEHVRGLVIRQANHSEGGEESGTLVLLDLPALLADPALIVREEIA